MTHAAQLRATRTVALVADERRAQHAPQRAAKEARQRVRTDRCGLPGARLWTLADCGTGLAQASR